MSDDSLRKTRLISAAQGKISRGEQISAIEEAGRTYYYSPEYQFDDFTKMMVIAHDDRSKLQRYDGPAGQRLFLPGLGGDPYSTRDI